MASINLQGDTSGSISISAPSVAGSNTLTLPATTQTLATQNALGVRNLIINGDMRIDQRYGGGAISAATLGGYGYTVDRWWFYGSQSSKFNAQQNQGSVTPPEDFKNYVGLTVDTSYTIGASDQFIFATRLEGLNTAHLKWGTANAKTVTLSYYVRSSLTGTFSGYIRNSASNRSYPFTYTIDSANTWEKKTITIAGDTTGTWLETNGTGIELGFNLGSGSSSSGTANTWAAANYTGATGATSVVGTSGATFYITGVQLEADTDTATPFEHRPWDDELIRCMRYYEKCINYSTVEPAGGYTGVEWTDIPRDKPANYAIKDVKYKVRKRAAATVNFWSLNQTVNQFGNVYSGADIGNAGAIWGGEQGFTWRNETGGTVSASTHNGLAVLWAASSEL